LWRGDIDGAIAQFHDWQHERVTTFIAYLNHHRHRIVNYGYYQAEGISIGSGAIESTIKPEVLNPEVLNPDGKTLQFRYLSALAAKFIDNIRINIDNIRINVDDFPAKLVPLD